MSVRRGSAVWTALGVLMVPGVLMAQGERPAPGAPVTGESNAPHADPAPDAPAKPGTKTPDARADEPGSPDSAGEYSLEGYVPPTGDGDSEDALDGYAPPTAAAPPDAEQELLPSGGEAEAEPAGERLPPPRAGEQLPKPVPESGPDMRRRHLMLGMYVGAAHRTSENQRAAYGTSLVYGPYVGVDVLPWLAVTAYARFEEIPVDVAADGFDTANHQYPDTSFEQESLDSVGLGMRVAPTLALTEQLELLAFFELAWNRFVAGAPTSRGANNVRSAERAGVGLNYKGGLGLTVEPLLDWLQLSLLGSAGVFAHQNGSAFDDVLQGFDRNGEIVHLAPLPRFGRSLELLLAVGGVL